MNGRIIMTASALLLFACGGLALFAPQEIAAMLGAPGSGSLALAIQLLGAALLGFAILDWMSRRNRIGGIYARPIGLANLLLFTASGLTLLRQARDGTSSPAEWGMAALCLLLAAAFAWLVFASDPLAPPPASPRD
ncbi:hypothetical protein [Sphingosinicella sp. BN140058]|uniref:hypothetical protein n=1 Tax=Sphingosinicella sp. BN140058 TaxID=1892855 RepID=UPI0010130B5C|nr:hypothetical protein [Sphingosinicella sp. BN140058]QAY76066.1 hypothetical protein ETR14_05645 [Sphingosinicella sp. BN140058]